MKKGRQAALRDFEGRLSYSFRDLSLLDHALTHRSFVNENPVPGRCDNERLEFLGDAVLGLCISDMLMEKFPEETEGRLSRMRALLVNEQSLADVSRHFGIGHHILLGRGEEASGGREKNSILANAFEALVAAVYLDGGFPATKLFLGQLFARQLEALTGKTAYRDCKTAIQEIAQNRFRENPRYTLRAEEGPDHEKVFEMTLTIGSIICTSGKGKSKKEAEQQAAKKALEQLEAPMPPDISAHPLGKEPCR